MHSMGCTVGSPNLSLCVHAYHITHVISIMPASQFHFQANKNAELAGGNQ